MMAPSNKEPVRGWKRLLRWLGLGKTKKLDQPVENNTATQVQNSTPKADTQPTPMNLEHPAPCQEPTPVSIVPELAHLTSRGQPRRPRRNFSRKYVVEPEEEARSPTPLLADRKLHGRWRVATSAQHHADANDSDEDVPVGQYVPRAHKLVMTPSRNHLRLVPKSPMSPLNGCDTAPANQRRRTPAPFEIATADGLQPAIEESTDEPCL